MPSATLSSKWQMVVPRPIREHLGVHPGDQIDFIILDDGSVIVRPVLLDAKQIRGIVRSPRKTPVSVEEMNETIRKAAGRTP